MEMTSILIEMKQESSKLMLLFGLVFQQRSVIKMLSFIPQL